MHVGIIGGGFAGRMAAVRLRRAGHAVTVIDAQRQHVERTRLHTAAASGRGVTVPHERLLGRVGARFVHDRVTALEDGRIVGVGHVVEVDRIVVAVGSEPVRDGPGVEEHTLSLGSPEEARTIHRRLAGLHAGARVVVVGAGLTGLELVTEVAAAHPHLDCTLVGDPSLDLSPHGARIVRRALAALGVRVMKTRVTEVREAGLDTDQGWLDSVLTLWAGGLRAPRWLQDAGLPLDADGRIAVDGALRVVGRPDVVAAGDCAGTRLRMACATAMPMGCHAADTLLREARGETPRPLSFGYVLRCISLGPGRALTQGTTSLDRPTWAIGGPLAAWTKASILAMVRAMPEVEARWMPGSYSWSGGPQLASAS